MSHGEKNIFLPMVTVFEIYRIGIRADMGISRGGDKRAAFNTAHLVRQNFTEKVIRLIALDSQLISMVEDQGFLLLEFLNPKYALPSMHYITLELQRLLK